MIKVNIEKQNDQISKITVSGHSGYDVSGKDIVCASASTIVITSVNAIMRMDEDSLTYKQAEGFVEVVIKKHSEVIDILIENMISLLKELHENYKKNIEIDE